MATESDPHGFFWRADDGFHCVIHHKARKVPTGKGKGKTAFCKQWSAPTPETLIKVCREENEEIGYDIGTLEKVRELCEAAPCWRGFIARRRVDGSSERQGKE